MSLSTGDVLRQLRSGPSLMDTICNFIIRPPRSTYQEVDLGPDVFRIGDDESERFVREDFDLINMRGMKVVCSWFKPYAKSRLPCVVYCHANCGGRYDGLEALFLLQHGFTLFAFDCCGSGMSSGEYISLGFYERQDLATVVEYLNARPTEVDGIALWGRSMGSVTAIMYGAKDPSIRCIICDSPFASLRLLIHDLVEQHGGRAAQYIPQSILNGIVEKIRKRIQKRAAFDIDDLDTVKYARECVVPTLLFQGEDDDFVSLRHSALIRDAFKGSCLHQIVPGGHNDERSGDIQNLIVAFLQLYLVEKPRGMREMQAEARRNAARKAAEEAAAAASAASGKPVSMCSPTSPLMGTVVPVASARRRMPVPDLATAMSAMQRDTIESTEDCDPNGTVRRVTVRHGRIIERPSHHDEEVAGQPQPISFVKPRLTRVSLSHLEEANASREADDEPELKKDL